jgi:hypothetical protein
MSVWIFLVEYMASDEIRSSGSPVEPNKSNLEVSRNVMRSVDSLECLPLAPYLGIRYFHSALRHIFATAACGFGMGKKTILGVDIGPRFPIFLSCRCSSDIQNSGVLRVSWDPRVSTSLSNSVIAAFSS